MSTEELKDEIKKSVSRIENDDLLHQVLTFVKGLDQKYSEESIKMHIDQIMKENHELLKRLAE